LSVLAAILLVVSYNMGEWREIPELLKLPRMEIAIWLATFLLTVFADLTVAVEAGMILAVLVFIKKVTQTTYSLGGNRRVRPRRACSHPTAQSNSRLRRYL